MKKKALKAVYIIIGVILVLLIVAVVAVSLFGGSAVKVAVESVATKTLGVGVTVEKVDLGIFTGRVGISNLVIDNPPEYQNEKFLELKDVRVQADIGSLLSDTVKIKKLHLDGMNVTLEQKGVTSNNLQDILKNIPKGEEKPQEGQEAEGPSKKLQIKDLEISNVSVNVKLLPIPGKADTVTLNLAPIKMTDLGTDEKLDIALLTSKILVAIAGGIAESGKGLLPDSIIGPLSDQLKELGELTGVMFDEGAKMLKEGADIGKDVLKEGEDIGKEITEGLKGIFKSKKEQ